MIKTIILVFITGIVFVFLFPCCINWAHVVESNELRTFETENETQERISTNFLL